MTCGFDHCQPQAECGRHATVTVTAMAMALRVWPDFQVLQTRFLEHSHAGMHPPAATVTVPCPSAQAEAPLVHAAPVRAQAESDPEPRAGETDGRIWPQAAECRHSQLRRELSPRGTWRTAQARRAARGARVLLDAVPGHVVRHAVVGARDLGVEAVRAPELLQPRVALRVEHQRPPPLQIRVLLPVRVQVQRLVPAASAVPDDEDQALLHKQERRAPCPALNRVLRALPNLRPPTTHPAPIVTRVESVCVAVLRSCGCPLCWRRAVMLQVGGVAVGMWGKAVLCGEASDQRRRTLLSSRQHSFPAQTSVPHSRQIPCTPSPTLNQPFCVSAHQTPLGFHVSNHPRQKSDEKARH
eukprot:1333553-Rhodomonas_salina.1